MVADRSDRDQFDRLLRYVFADGIFVNAELVDRGLAVARRYAPDTGRADELDLAQQRARAAGLGMWAADACGPESRATLRIADVVYDPPGDDTANLNAEFVVIRNEGPQAVSLDDWSLRDTSARHRFDFPPDFALAASASVTLRTGCGTPTATDLYWCVSGSAVWNNDGDTAFLIDPSGNIADTYSYGAG